MGFGYPRTSVAMLDASTDRDRGFNSAAISIADSLGAALEGSGMDARLKPLTLDRVAVSTEPLTEAAITPDEALSLMQAAMVELAGEDFRNWR
jgi:hypothetical protein